MGTWVPNRDEIVAPNECVGRRIFHRQLKGAKDQKPLPEGRYELFHFEETRDNGDVSVDRMGRSSIEKKVLRYLNPRCQHAVTKMQGEKQFKGWAITRAKALQQPSKGPRLNVVPSPVDKEDGDDLSENLYHAHVERPEEYKTITDPHYQTAMHLKAIFEKEYQFEPMLADENAGEMSSALLPRLPSFLHRLCSWCEEKWVRIMSED